MSDNNLLALALVMVLPLLEYCREVSWNKTIKLICILVITLTIVAILGTYSRGGLIAFSAVLVSFWWRSKRHLLTIGLVIAATAAVIFILPQKWNERMATIEAAQSDQSFMSRLQAWKTAIWIGVDRPMVGAGYRATEKASIYAHYNPEAEVTRGSAIHNAFLQVLADHGFVGLALFGLMFFMAIGNCRWVATRCSSLNQLKWLAYLASMLEIGFIGYGVGGAALSVAYYDVFLVLVVVSSLIKDYAKREVTSLEYSGPTRVPQAVAGVAG